MQTTSTVDKALRTTLAGFTSSTPGRCMSRTEPLDVVTSIIQETLNQHREGDLRAH